MHRRNVGGYTETLQWEEGFLVLKLKFVNLEMFVNISA